MKAAPNIYHLKFKKPNHFYQPGFSNLSYVKPGIT